MLSYPVRKHFLEFCTGECDATAFEEWVCAAADVEDQIGHGPHLDLISADYRGRDAWAARELCRRLLEQHHPGGLGRYRASRILESMVADESKLLSGLRELVALRHQGHEFIPIHFVGFESQTDTIPTPDRYHLWSPDALAEKLAQAEPYFAEIREASRELLADLQKQSPDLQAGVTL